MTRLSLHRLLPLISVTLLGACGGTEAGQPLLSGEGAGGNGGGTVFPGAGTAGMAPGGAVGAGGGAGTGSGGNASVGYGGTPVLGAGGALPAGGSFGAGGGAVGGAPQQGSGGNPMGGAGAGSGGAPPAMGTEYTFQTGNFSVPPGGEVYKCQDFTNPFGKDIGILQMQTALTPGSHHMFAFVMPSGQLSLMGSLQDCPSGGVEFHDYLTTTGSPTTTVNYPAGVGRVFASGNGLRLNVHLINTDVAPKNASIMFKVVYTDPATLKQKAASIFLNQVGLSVAAGMSTHSKSYSLTQDIWLMGDASHMHKRGVHFVAKASSGQMLYDGTEWAEPKQQTFDPALHLTSGTQISWACTYNNDTGKTLTFGESASANEMCIFVGEFYNPSGTQISYQSLF
jgi:hypothetical protein